MLPIWHKKLQISNKNIQVSNKQIHISNKNLHILSKSNLDFRRQSKQKKKNTHYKAQRNTQQ